MFSAPEAAVVTVPYLQLVRQAGREYAQAGCICQELAEKLAILMIREETYAAICNGNA